MREYFTKKKGVAQVIPSTKYLWSVETINSQSITVLEKDSSWNVLKCTGTVTITGGGAGYAKGCIYIDTDITTWTSWVYENVWTTASCSFTKFSDILASEIALADWKLLVGWATNVAAAQTPSGDVTMTNTGVMVIGTDKVSSTMIAPSVLKVATTTIATASVLTLNSTPIVLVPAVAWKTIAVDSIVATINYAGVAYATNVTMEFSYTTATTKVTADIAALLDATADKAVKVGGIEAALVCAVNDGVQVKVAAGNPTAGTSDIIITVVYREVTTA